jgi:hypothetical protein
VAQGIRRHDFNATNSQPAATNKSSTAKDYPEHSEIQIYTSRHFSRFNTDRLDPFINNPLAMTPRVANCLIMVSLSYPKTSRFATKALFTDSPRVLTIAGWILACLKVCSSLSDLQVPRLFIEFCQILLFKYETSNPREVLKNAKSRSNSLIRLRNSNE